jgi:hypothetical protein
VNDRVPDQALRRVTPAAAFDRRWRVLVRLAWAALGLWVLALLVLIVFTREA